MAGDDRYEDHISAVLQECPGVDRDEIRSAFQKYEEEFFIPPQDAIRSIIRRFKSETDAQPTATAKNWTIKSANKESQPSFRIKIR